MPRRRSPSFRDRYGQWALVAGGSQGIGAEFAESLARRGLDLLLLAEAPSPLEEVARRLSHVYGVQVRARVLDLSTPDLLGTLRPWLAGLEVGLLVCNAAHAPIGPFVEQALEDKLKVLDVNCRAPLALIHELAPAMRARGRGGVVLMSSLAALQGTALVATYAASKAFARVLGEALWEELGPHGVDALAVCPGAVRTPALAASGARAGALLPVLEPRRVAEEALEALGRTASIVVGHRNRLSALLFERLLPRRLSTRVMGRAMRATYPRRG